MHIIDFVPDRLRDIAEKHRFALFLSIVFWGLGILLYRVDGETNILCLFGLGFVSLALPLNTAELTIGHFLISAFSGFALGWLIEIFWRWKKWSIAIVGMLAFINSYGFAIWLFSNID